MTRDTEEKILVGFITLLVIVALIALNEAIDAYNEIPKPLHR